ncbi:hypothetical protein GCM10010246_04600 [Streptomyces cuspidosporus]|uniref:Transposase IS4-like domain-containing protein n=1 Tax=Streptomyces cuspidosporus TaxID=66882 RepID=A0ABN3FBQ1_9ACTN
MYGYFAKWQKDGVFAQLTGMLRRLLRQKEGKHAEPSACVIDAQSIKTSTSVPAAGQGTDAAKKIVGRKRSIVTDTLGLLLAVLVTAGHTGLDRRVQSAPLAAVQKAAEASGGHHDAVGHERTARRRTSLTLSIAALRHSPHTTSVEGRLRSVPTASVIQTFLSAGSVGGTPNTAKAPP